MKSYYLNDLRKMGITEITGQSGRYTNHRGGCSSNELHVLNGANALVLKSDICQDKTWTHIFIHVRTYEGESSS